MALSRSGHMELGYFSGNLLIEIIHGHQYT